MDAILKPVLHEERSEQVYHILLPRKAYYSSQVSTACEHEFQAAWLISLFSHIAVMVDPWKYVADRDVILSKMSHFFIASPLADLVV